MRTVAPVVTVPVPDVLNPGIPTADDALLEALEAHPWHRLLVSPDHPTPIRVRTHTRGLVPFALWGTDVDSIQAGPYNEVQAERAGLVIQLGHELMEFFLKG